MRFMRYRNYLDGEWTDPSGDRAVPNLNPARTSDVIGEVPLSTLDDVDRAIEAAARAQKAWRKVPAPTRGRAVARLHHILERRAEELAVILTREEGKLLCESRGEVAKSLHMLEFTAGEGLRLGGRTRVSEFPNNTCYTMRRPIGVCGLITPWNFPVCLPLWKIAPAIVAGNAIILKPATVTVGTATFLFELFEEAEIPPGVCNLVLGSGSVVGQALVEDPRVPVLSFTGSNQVGTRLYVDGAKLLKKVQCEMGGKNPIVVLEDADLELAALACAQGAFGSTGQRCTATSRAVVMESVADRFVELVKGHAERIVVGDGRDPTSDMGPSVDENQHQTVLRYMQIARDEDKADLVCGGERLSGPAYDEGYFSPPTIFDHVTPSMRIAQEEVFGPVLSVLRVQSFDEALEVANHVEFGLSSSLYTRDTARWYRFVDEIESGMTHLNSSTAGGEPQMPFGGIKGTSVGDREMGEAGVGFFTEEQTVYVDYTGDKRESLLY